MGSSDDAARNREVRTKINSDYTDRRALGFEWPHRRVESNICHGERFDLLSANGFELERLVELFAPANAQNHEHYEYVSADWARQWPAKEIWVARKR
jgi:hypothetical protein